MIKIVIFVLLILVLIIILTTILLLIIKNKSKAQSSSERKMYEPLNIPQEQNEKSKNIINYLSRLYPTTNIDNLIDTKSKKYLIGAMKNATSFFSRIPQNELIDLYLNKLEWYYTPLACISEGQYPFQKDRYNLKDMSENAECSAYLTDGMDISSTKGQSCDTFTCSAFQSSGDSQWGVEKGTPYQVNLFIKPYGRRHGVPNYSYVESVAFPCESLGRILYNAGNPNGDCSDKLPIGKGYPTNPIDGQQININEVSFESQINPNPYLDWSLLYACQYPTKENYQDDKSQSPGFGESITSDSGILSIGCWTTGNPKTQNGQQGIPNLCISKYGGSVLCGDFGSCTNPCFFVSDQNLDDTEFTPQNFQPKSNGYYFVYTNKQEGTSDKKCITIDESCKIPELKYPLIFSNDEHWLSWLYKFNGSTYELIQGFENIVPNTFLNQKNTGIYPSAVDKTMFYWCKGYGKFINYGKTGVYLNYNHFVLTCPQKGLACKNNFGIDNSNCVKDNQEIKVNPRWSFPMLVLLSDNYLKKQIKDLMNPNLKDNRKYLSGFCTTLRNPKYEAVLPKNSKGYVLNDSPNNYVKWGKNSVGNVSNSEGYPILYNPADETFLKLIEKMTISKYYPPEEKIKNPCYNINCNFNAFQAVILCAAMQIYGDNGNDCTLDIKGCNTNKNVGRGTYPFGSFFTGSNVGGCVYKTLRSLQWDSVQITQMPTGAGRGSYCTQPGYDFEIIVLGAKNFLCKAPDNLNKSWINSDKASLYKNELRDDFYPGFCQLDISKDWINYINNGFIQGTGNLQNDIKKYNLMPFQGPKSNSDYAMLLTEINNPPNYLPPNTQWYNYVHPGYWNCSYKDSLISKYKNGIPQWLKASYDKNKK